MEIFLSNYLKKWPTTGYLHEFLFLVQCANSVIMTKEQQAENAKNGYKPWTLMK